MQKVYLLLRSNKQTGPYTLEELLQLNLKPFDLVWMEGRSAAWQYPSEIPTLKPYVSETPQAEVPFRPIATATMEERPLQEPPSTSQKTETPKRVFVSVPKPVAPVSEQKNYTEHQSYMPAAISSSYEPKEAVKPVTSSYSQASASYSKQKPVEEEVQTNYSRSLNDVEQDYTNWVYQSKTKKKSPVNVKELVLAALILSVIGGGYYVMSKPSVANSVLPANKIATQATQPVENNPAAIEQQDQNINTEQKQVSTPGVVTPDETQKIKTKNHVTVSKGQTNSSVPPVQNSMPVEKTTNIPDQNEDVVSKEPEVKQVPKVESTPEKKKKLGEVIKGIFSKKEKTEEASTKDVVTEDPKPANNRQATRRDNNNDNSSIEKQEEVNVADLSNQVDITSNAPDNWMMGIKNLKITLRNRSNVTIQTASVTVNYYNENNELLEKKLVYFNNIAPKAKLTVAAPDHKWADHVDFKLTTISAKEDRYASNQ